MISTGCVSHLAAPGPARDAKSVDNTYSRGHVDVVCLEGMNRGSDKPDTLFGCLKAARDKGLGTVDLPKGVYLGHVAEFIVRSLKYYEIEKHFERFYGYRIVLNFREAGVWERKESEFENYSGMIVGTAGELAATGAGIAIAPLAPLIFAFKAVKHEAKRGEIAKQAREQGLPEPSRGGGVVALREILNSYERLSREAVKAAGQGDSDNIMEIYLVEECYLEKPDLDHILYLSGRLNVTKP